MERKLNSAQEALIKETLIQRFKQYGIVNLVYTALEGTRIGEFTQEIPLNQLDIFSLALTECVFVAKVFVIEEVYLIQTGLRYFHQDGGCNGCNLPVEFWLLADKIIDKS